MRRIVPLLVALLLAPAIASAITLQDVVTLSKAGVSDAVLLAMIERDRTIFAIDAEQLLALRREGVSEPVVLAMLKSGREEPAPTPTAPLGPSEEPILVMVGHGPDRPNTYHSFDRLEWQSPVFYSYAPLVVVAPASIPQGACTHAGRAPCLPGAGGAHGPARSGPAAPGDSRGAPPPASARRSR